MIGVKRVYPRLSFEMPVGLFQAPGDNSRWFVIEQGGVISQFPNTPNPAASTLVLDIIDRAECCGEGGLLGLAFHPNFPATPLAYVTIRAGSVIRYRSCRYIGVRTTDGGQTLDPNSSAAAQAQSCLIRITTAATSRSTDGYLYIGFGDGGSGSDPQNHAQNVEDLLAHSCAST